MSNKKMLTEGTVRRFMKLARVDSLSDRFVNEMYSSPMEEDEALQEKGCGTMEEDMMGVSEEDGSLEAGFEGQADADGIEAMQEIDYTAHGDVDVHGAAVVHPAHAAGAGEPQAGAPHL